MKQRLIICGFFSLCFYWNLQAQTIDSLKVPAKKPFLKNIEYKWNDFFYDDEAKPKKALYMSLVVPGLGQVYNGQDYKVPFIYGGLVGAALYTDFYQAEYDERREALVLMLDDDPANDIEKYSYITSDALRRLRNDARKKVERGYFWLVGVYLANAADAFVGAHLREFDVSDDLTLQIAPKVDFNTSPSLTQNTLANGNFSAGVNFTFRFK